jgi:hypothetical protein
LVAVAATTGADGAEQMIQEGRRIFRYDTFGSFLNTV